jgi:hypothetical protein
MQIEKRECKILLDKEDLFFQREKDLMKICNKK